LGIWWGNSVLTQQEFDAEFITAAEIYRCYPVSRPSLHYARQRGAIPDGAIVLGTMIWRRAELQPFLDAWIVSVENTKLRQRPRQIQELADKIQNAIKPDTYEQIHARSVAFQEAGEE